MLCQIVNAFSTLWKEQEYKGRLVETLGCFIPINTYTFWQTINLVSSPWAELEKHWADER